MKTTLERMESTLERIDIPACWNGNDNWHIMEFHHGTKWIMQGMSWNQTRNQAQIRFAAWKSLIFSQGIISLGRRVIQMSFLPEDFFSKTLLWNCHRSSKENPETY